MRAVMLVLALCVCVTTVWGQDGRVTMPSHQTTLTELFDQIGRQTRSTVMFDADDAALGATVELPVRSATVEQMLAWTLPSAGYTWRVVNSYILVAPVERPDPQPNPQPTRAQLEADIAAFIRTEVGTDPEPTIRRDTVIKEIAPPAEFRYEGSRKEFRTTPPAQLVVGTNLVWWAARGTINGTLEFPLGGRTSIELAGGINRWNLAGSSGNNRKLTHWVVRPEFRFWFCERMAEGHFVGLHALYGQFNVGGVNILGMVDRRYRYEGQAAGVGVSYGYKLDLTQRWGMEFVAGVGGVAVRYTKSECAKCGLPVYRGRAFRVAPTNVGIKFTYKIK